MDIVSPNEVAQLLGLSPSALASAASVHLSDLTAVPNDINALHGRFETLYERKANEALGTTPHE